MFVVGHGHGGLGGGRDGGDEWYACRTGVLVACREIPVNFLSER